MKKPVSDILLLVLGLTVLFAIALDASRTGKSADKRPSYPSDGPNKPEPKSSFVSSGIDNLNDESHELRPVKRFTTARAGSFNDKPDHSATGAGLEEYRTNYANENLNDDDLEGAADDSQDDADESEDTADESEDTSGDSEDDADDCVE